MFDEKSMREWCNGLTGKDKEYVEWFVCRASQHDDEKPLWQILIDARKAVILRNAIGIISYASLKTPTEVYNELKGP